MISQQALELLKRESQFITSLVHGLHHWQTVERNGHYLARFLPAGHADTEVISYFAYFHDCMRVKEATDIAHGPRAKVFLRKNRSLIPLDYERFELLCIACSTHTFGKRADCTTLGICWDADRLDLNRPHVEITREANFFHTHEARQIVTTNDDSPLIAFGKMSAETTS